MILQIYRMDTMVGVTFASCTTTLDELMEAMDDDRPKPRRGNHKIWYKIAVLGKNTK